MTDIAQVNPAAQVFAPHADAGAAAIRRTAGAPDAAPAQADRVELSDRALLLSRLRELPEIRAELVDQARARIEAGDYDTPERLDAAIEAMLRDAEELPS